MSLDGSNFEDLRAQQLEKLGDSAMSGHSYIEYARGYPPGVTHAVNPGQLQAQITAGELSFIETPIGLGRVALEEMLGPLERLQLSNNFQSNAADPNATPDTAPTITADNPFDIGLEFKPNMGDGSA